MEKIDVDENKAQQYATAIGKSSNKLSIGSSVSFSDEVTVEGKPKASNEYTTLMQATKQAQCTLNRDIQNIHSVVSNFESMDKKIQKTVDAVTEGMSKIKGSKK